MPGYDARTNIIGHFQIEFVLDVMSTLPKPIIRWSNSREYTQTVGRGFCGKFMKWLSGSAWNYTYKTEEVRPLTFWSTLLFKTHVHVHRLVLYWAIPFI